MSGIGHAAAPPPDPQPRAQNSWDLAPLTGKPANTAWPTDATGGLHCRAGEENRDAREALIQPHPRQKDLPAVGG
jgi:hypothetical protein